MRFSRGARTVGKDRKTGRNQITFRVPPDLYARLEAAAEGNGTDISGLLRMMTLRFVHVYEEQAEENRKHDPKRKGE